ncbi:MAG: hypothetical protein EOP11_03980 [Proteobacteria bacterium]|nr:MAG: hypothetical protein EOP11_03980 [Pseudomonadota bacterium]
MSLIALLFLFTAPLAQAERTCPARFAKFNREELEKLVLSDTDRNLFDEQMSLGTPEEAEFWNRTLIDAVDGLPKPKPAAKRLPSLNPEQRAALLKLVDKHPVADAKFYDKYAPEGGTGFCFGRAITAHIEALRMGLDKESIKKIWIVGAMEGTSDSWGHHVATIVRGPKGKWYTIDPNYDTPPNLLA